MLEVKNLKYSYNTNYQALKGVSLKVEKGQMVALLGKNGAGKSYLANKLYYLGFKRNVGYTTRPIREGEIDGIDYFFITKEKFEEYIVNNDFVFLIS